MKIALSIYGCPSVEPYWIVYEVTEDSMKPIYYLNQRKATLPSDVRELAELDLGTCWPTVTGLVKGVPSYEDWLKAQPKPKYSFTAVQFRA